MPLVRSIRHKAVRPNGLTCVPTARGDRAGSFFDLVQTWAIAVLLIRQTSSYVVATARVLECMGMQGVGSWALLPSLANRITGTMGLVLQVFTDMKPTYSDVLLRMRRQGNGRVVAVMT